MYRDFFNWVIAASNVTIMFLCRGDDGRYSFEDMGSSRFSPGTLVVLDTKEDALKMARYVSSCNADGCLDRIDGDMRVVPLEQSLTAIIEKAIPAGGEIDFSQKRKSKAT
jgi:hypothetical protein